MAGGPEKIEIDFKHLDQLCAIQCTLVEIADFFQCSEDTIERRVKEEKGVTFAEYFKVKSSKGKRSLRRIQWEMAQKHDRAMVIWLGKQWLGQRDNKDINVTDLQPIKLQYALARPKSKKKQEAEEAERESREAEKTSEDSEEKS